MQDNNEAGDSPVAELLTREQAICHCRDSEVGHDLADDCGVKRSRLTPFSRTRIQYAPARPNWATGTCPDCGQTAVKVVRRELHGFGALHVGPKGCRLGVVIELVAHKAPDGQVCAATGKLPVGLRFTPSPLIAEWTEKYGAGNVR